MVKDIGIFVNVDKEKDNAFISKMLIDELAKSGIRTTAEEMHPVCLKKSVDARHGKQKFYLKYKVYIGEDPDEALTKIPEWKKADGKKTVAIIGSGPAGLFAALKLLEKGIKPVVIDRGSDTSKRKRDIAKISTGGVVDAHSNYCFGEGGAGTFSDGKLYTRSNKRGDISCILKIFAHFGADKKILTDAHPHIGTDRLPKIINNMREHIISLGGEFYFDTMMTDFVAEKSDGGLCVKGIVTKNTVNGEEKTILSDAVILATGHSSLEVYDLIAKISPSTLEAKTFAVGVRVEHPRSVIDKIQYRGKNSESLGAAEYRITSQQKERGVYSFCMCPGGFVVPSATSGDQIVVNGMSSANRNSRWSNAAIVVETRPEDIPQEYRDKSAKEYGSEVMAGLLWRTDLERLTFKQGNNQQAPAQRLVDFIRHKDSQSLPESSYTPGLVPSRLDKWLPEQIKSRLESAFHDFDKKMRGYICENALMIASETRTSTPVRICRDKESYQAVGIKNLYPAGEGSGYAGGIVSSAMDGENAAQKISG